MIKVLNTAVWIHSQNSCSSGGLCSQVTMCEWNDIIFYVRENVNGVNSFEISSAERWGDKNGSTPARRRQTLELMAPGEHWSDIRKLVLAADPLRRPVKQNQNFNEAFIKTIFK